MKIGMLWYGDLDKSVAENIAAAFEHYTAKFGREPNCCHVHPSALVDLEVLGVNVTLVASNHTLPNHYWIGCENDEKLVIVDEG